LTAAQPSIISSQSTSTLFPALTETPDLLHPSPTPIFDVVIDNVAISQQAQIYARGYGNGLQQLVQWDGASWEDVTGNISTVVDALKSRRLSSNIPVMALAVDGEDNLEDVPAIIRLVEDYALTTQARVFYNIFQAFPRAMFSVEWENLLVTEQEFATLKRQIGNRANIRISFLDHETLDKLYVMVFPDGSIGHPQGRRLLELWPIS